MSQQERQNRALFTIYAIQDFAKQFALSTKVALAYLLQYKGIEFIETHYEVEHMQSFEDTLSDLIKVCKHNGGSLSL